MAEIKQNGKNHALLLSRVLFSAAFLLFALRFLWPGDTVYTLDEPFQQIRIDEHFAAGTIPFSNSRGSSIPLPYGPGALWLFMLIRLFTWQPVAVVLCHLCFQSLGAWLFVSTLRKAYGTETAAWCALLAASSPLLFFYARHPWDPTLLIVISAILLWLVQKLRDGGKEIPLHIALGFVAGYGLNTHLMFGPMAMAAGLTLAQMNGTRYGFRSRKFYLLLFIFAAAAFTVLLPYLIEAFKITQQEQPLDHARNKHHWGDARNLWWLFQRTALFSSLYGSRIHMDPDGVRAQFFSFVGPFWAFFFHVDFFGWFGKLAAWGSAFAVIFQLARGRLSGDPLRFFASMAFFGTLLVYQFLNIPTAPHYFNPIWWFVFVGIACALIRLQGWQKRLFLVTLVCSIIINTTYVVTTLAYIHANRGARNMETSVVVDEQLRMFRELCEWARAHRKALVRVDKSAVSLEDPPFDFLPHHMPECSGIAFTLVPKGAEADFRLRHPADSPTSAALITDLVPKQK